jgi:hypothetical protein
LFGLSVMQSGKALLRVSAEGSAVQAAAIDKLWRRCLDREKRSDCGTARILAARHRYSTEFRTSELLMRGIISKG